MLQLVAALCLLAGALLVVLRCCVLVTLVCFALLPGPGAHGSGFYTQTVDDPADAHHLEVFQQPGNTTGGIAFDPQPIIIAVDATGRRLNFTGGTVTAAVWNNPSGYGVVEGSDFATVEWSHGWANFTDLFINLQGDAYTLRFTGLDMWVESQPFNVSMGPPAKIAIAVQPGSAYGGEALAPQPAVEVQDAGGNPYILAGVDVQCWVEILTDPSGHATLTQPNLNPDNLNPNLDPLHARAHRGRMTFEKLQIDAAGIGYQLRFTTNVEAIYGITPSYLDSENFTVGIGQPAQITVLTQPGGILGGHPFAQQPVVAVRDAGGNVDIHDSESTITVSVEVCAMFSRHWCMCGVLRVFTAPANALPRLGATDQPVFCNVDAAISPVCHELHRERDIRFQLRGHIMGPRTYVT